MLGPHIPTPLEQLGRRPFSFYPAIVGETHNEWIFRRAHAEEIQVMNAKSRRDIWIPRRFLASVSSIEEPFIIVGLAKELECRQGLVAPRVQRLIEMPRAVGEWPRISRPIPDGWRAPVVGIRIESPAKIQSNRKVLGAAATLMLVCILGMVILRATPASSRARLFASSRRVSLPFSAKDDYLSIVNRWGHPDLTSAYALQGGGEIYLMNYSQRNVTLVVSGMDRYHATYLGALGRNGRLYPVTLSNGFNTRDTLNQLR